MGSLARHLMLHAHQLRWRVPTSQRAPSTSYIGVLARRRWLYGRVRQGPLHARLGLLQQDLGVLHLHDARRAHLVVLPVVEAHDLAEIQESAEGPRFASDP